uniref:Uncharacterized protein MANES_09G163800 n=1 Tax=Rhizophora mucronata TaxID=61149 RepID=A0A2P2MXI3_RHIMU
MDDPGLDPNTPPGLHLVSGFLAMEPTDSLLSMARECGGGSITDGVQRFVWEHCISKTVKTGYAYYIKNFVKKLIFEIESSHGTVADELYEQYGYYMTSLRDDVMTNGNSRVCKCISFLFPAGCYRLPSFPQSRKLVLPLHCSLNMLEGDTGCSLWPSSLYMSEIILSFPDRFMNRSCFEVGSGVGLVGICLSYIKASKVTLSDGDLSTLANMKLNLELNQLSTGNNVPERSGETPKKVKCIHLPWESATEGDLQEFMPDIVLGADIIYDPQCLPHLVRVLAILLNQTKTDAETRKEDYQVSSPGSKHHHVEANGSNQENIHCDHDLASSDPACDQRCSTNKAYAIKEYYSRPVAYISSIIRNVDTFNCFLELAEQANLIATDVTETLKPLNLLPYMHSYNRSSIRLFTVTCK